MYFDDVSFEGKALPKVKFRGNVSILECHSTTSGVKPIKGYVLLAN